jgi:diguanylate cyclase (GGDEF)-like protein/PAS domain S-box-containing protein
VNLDQWLENVVANVPGAIYRCVLRSDWEMKFMSPEIERITGYPASDFIDSRVRTYESVIHPDDRAGVEHAVVAAVDRKEQFTIDYRVLHRDGGMRWVHEQGRGALDEHGELSLLDGAIFDITARKEMEAELSYLAFHDVLTGLPNRALVAENLELALARARRHGTQAAVLFVDLDDFKLINDDFGHAAGDELLKEVAHRLRATVRETDTVARQGGDEFLVLAPDLRSTQELDVSSEAIALAERVRQALTPPVAISGMDVYVSASIGIAMFPRDADTAEDLLKRADTAMYRAKDAGRDGFAFAEAPSASSSASASRVSQAGRLRRALEREEFELHYQPLVRLSDGAMLGVEALIRWRDPEHGLVSPDAFIPLAERTGAITRISDWVVAEACRQVREWSRQGLELYVSVNLPARFWRMTAMRSVLDTVEKFGVAPGRLMLEITESTAMEHPEGNEAIVQALHDRGVRVAIDDFGTGHSSLARLHQLAMTILKIDRSFIRDLPGDPAAAVLVSGIVGLTRSLGLEPLAEGIETEHQRQFLLAHGCEMGQGYLFSRPVPPELVPAYEPPGVGAPLRAVS